MIRMRMTVRFRWGALLLAFVLIYVTILVIINHNDQLFALRARRELPRGYLDDIMVTEGVANFHYIHFVETSGNKTNLAPREACAIESAARAHPNSAVILYVLNKMHYDANDPFMQMFYRDFKNIAILVLDLQDLFNSTPLYDWYMDGGLIKSKFPTHHLSDALRFSLLYKYGGVYQDTDSITLRSMMDLKNAIALESRTGVGCGVLVFDQYSPFIKKCLHEYVDGYDGAEWGAQGPSLVTRVIRKTCDIQGNFNTTIVTHCPDINIYPLKTFYALPLPQLFKTLKYPHKLNFPANHYAAHTWASQSMYRKAWPGSGSVIDVLFKTKCPSAYSIMEEMGSIQGVPNKCLLYQNDKL